MSKMIESFLCVIELEEYLVVDETMIPFRGRLIFKQHISGKPQKYVLKLFKYRSTKVVLTDILIVL